MKKLLAIALAFGALAAITAPAVADPVPDARGLYRGTFYYDGVRFTAPTVFDIGQAAGPHGNWDYLYGSCNVLGIVRNFAFKGSIGKAGDVDMTVPLTYGYVLRMGGALRGSFIFGKNISGRWWLYRSWDDIVNNRPAVAKGNYSMSTRRIFLR